MEAIITVKNLRKIYKLGPERVVALECINLEVPKGQICCILGTSGSGKSTLLNQLAGLEKPTKGAVYISGSNISKMSERQLAKFRQKHLGFVFQSYNLLPALTALENVAMPLMFQGMKHRKRDKRAKEMLALVGLRGRVKHKPTQMSGGQQQRVGIARAFVARPSIIFADEPTGNLDTKTTVEVMQLMVRVAHEYNQTLLLVTHDNELAQFADRIVTLIDGQIVSDHINEHQSTEYIPYKDELAKGEDNQMAQEKTKSQPQTDAPASVPPGESQPQTDAPASVPPGGSQPQTDAPASVSPGESQPQTDAPASVPPEGSQPQTDAPASVSPGGSQPQTDAPASGSESITPAVLPPQSTATANNQGEAREKIQTGYRYINYRSKEKENE